MSISKFMAHKIITSLYIPDGESWFVRFPHCRTCYTWSYTNDDRMYHIFAANLKELEKEGLHIPTRVRDGYDMRLSFVDMPITAFNCWKCVAHISREEVFSDTTAILGGKD